jgi:cytochrome c
MKGKTYLVFYAMLPISVIIGGFTFHKNARHSFGNHSKSTMENGIPLADVGQENNSPLHQANTRPQVQILAPIEKSSYLPGTRVAYKISVSDPEDGDSKYGEISQNEVLLKVEYMEQMPVPIEENNTIQEDPLGLVGILRSNCLNCHAFKSKLIGPSLYEIGKRYAPSPENLKILLNRIKEGSSGIWGSTVMPAHPELSSQEILEMEKWILENADNPNIDYYTGTEGSIKLPTLPTIKKNSVFVLTASYTDHGVDGAQKLRGRNDVVIYPKYN